MKLKKKWKYAVVFLVILSAIYLAHPLYLKALGNFLVVSDPLVKADAIVVLDGDPRGERLLHSVKLWRSGYAPKVLLSARLAKWQTYEDYPSWRHAMKLKMFPEDTLSVAAHKADSTREEAQYFLRFVRQEGLRKGVASSQFHPDKWWKRRADGRTFFYEFSKIIWYALVE